MNDSPSSNEDVCPHGLPLPLSCSACNGIVDYGLTPKLAAVRMALNAYAGNEAQTVEEIIETLRPHEPAAALRIERDQLALRVKTLECERDAWRGSSNAYKAEAERAAQSPLADQDGPGEEDGPWADGWEQRASQPPTEQPSNTVTVPIVGELPVSAIFRHAREIARLTETWPADEAYYKELLQACVDGWTKGDDIAGPILRARAALTKPAAPDDPAWYEKLEFAPPADPAPDETEAAQETGPRHRVVMSCEACGGAAIGRAQYSPGELPCNKCGKGLDLHVGIGMPCPTDICDCDIPTRFLSDAVVCGVCGGSL